MDNLILRGGYHNAPTSLSALPSSELPLAKSIDNSPTSSFVASNRQVIYLNVKFMVLKLLQIPQTQIS